jgi:hypothetical protein
MTDLSLAHSYACARVLDANGAPQVPGGFASQAEADGWYSVRNADGSILLAAWRANSVGTDGLFAVFGPQATLDALAALEPRCMPAQELWALARSGNATAITVVRRWPTWRFVGAAKDRAGVMQSFSGVARLIFEGQTMPTLGTAFPWRFAGDGTIVATDGAARYRVDGPIGTLTPALHATLAGYQLHAIAEDEAPR